MMSEKPWRIVFSEPFSSEAIARMQSVGAVRELTACDEQALIDAVADCDALLVRTSSQVTRRVIEAAPNLRVIGRGGVGLDNIDLAAAREKHIPVVYTPHAATEAVADLTFALILGLTWNLRAWDRGVREGQFAAARASAFARELCGLKLGIIGMGRIGRAVARRAVHGFLMNILYHDIVDVGESLGFPARRLGKDEVLENSDIVSLHVPLTEATRGSIGAKELELFGPGTILIHTSRGPVVDALALNQALRTGRLGGAGLDVYDPEPLPPGHPLLTAPNTLFTPHVGARTALAQERMNGVVVDVVRVLEGKKPQYAAL